MNRVSAAGFTIEGPNHRDKFAVTYNLATVWVTRAEAERIAAGDHKLAASVLARLDRKG